MAAEPDLAELTDPQLLDLMRRTATRSDTLNQQRTALAAQFAIQRAELAKRRP